MFLVRVSIIFLKKYNQEINKKWFREQAFSLSYPQSQKEKTKVQGPKSYGGRSSNSFTIQVLQIQKGVFREQDGNRQAKGSSKKIQTRSRGLESEGALRERLRGRDLLPPFGKQTDALKNNELSYDTLYLPNIIHNLFQLDKMNKKVIIKQRLKTKRIIFSFKLYSRYGKHRFILNMNLWKNQIIVIQIF
ncbi:unnamed protein product [Paramecium pentaurelia]|uniref:Uncharacterized protein n=1 Tax=Paramecium pentaurelia TaxID=43138 RepID=A0A8S1WDZ2_9CILI|nr:unnamed protein product [Paramecium pentaurelia]